MRLRRKKQDQEKQTISELRSMSTLALTLYLPRSIVRDTHEYFRPYCQAAVETACYWFGVQVGALQIVTTLAVPKLLQTPGNYKVEMLSMRRLSASMRSQGLVSLAQIHTHPNFAVGHSSYDDEFACSTRDGALSLIWPYYGLTLSHNLKGVGVEELRARKWVDLNQEEIAQRIRLVDSLADYRWDITKE